MEFRRVLFRSVGEWTTTSLAVGKEAELEVIREIHFPHSLGLLYSAFTYYTGFKVNSGEYKVMGLAPYGEPRYAKAIREHLIDVKDDGSFRLDMQYFNYCTGLTMGAPIRTVLLAVLLALFLDLHVTLPLSSILIALTFLGTAAVFGALLWLLREHDSDAAALLSLRPTLRFTVANFSLRCSNLRKYAVSS